MPYSANSAGAGAIPPLPPGFMRVRVIIAYSVDGMTVEPAGSVITVTEERGLALIRRGVAVGVKSSRRETTELH